MNSKRCVEDSRPRKIPRTGVKILEEKDFQFRVALPNSTTIEVNLSELRDEIPMEEFIELVRKEYDRAVKKSKKRIYWKYKDIHFTDSQLNEIKSKVRLCDFTPNKLNFLWLHDGSTETDVYEDVLKELSDYTFETALANLIDNSVQNVWSNGDGERRLISLELLPRRISIFDSGPGMDGAAANLEKWGGILASLHKPIGGDTSYSMPFFSMFGYGGPVAATCFGKRAVISSKTKNCDKVLTVNLDRECSKNLWRTKGGMRDPSEDETEKSLHGSFTKVEIFDPAVKTLDVKRLRCKLKDIFFPYIEETSTPIEFQVNGIDLSQVQGGEEAVTILHACNGPDFVLQLHFSISQDSSSMACQKRVFLEAKARLKCVYFPIVEGKESIMRILDGCGIRECFESFNRVSVRSSGRLLPNARWALLPFMEPKQKTCEKGDKTGHFSRVKCFIDTDSGFNTTSHKTDLDRHHPYTKALKNFGNASHGNENEVQVEIYRDGNKLTLIELEEQYNAWITEMHDRYDEEHNHAIKKSRDIRLKHVVEVRAPYAARWKILNHNKDRLYTIRVGSRFQPLYVSCVNRYDNCVLFTKVPKLNIELKSNGKVLARICSEKVDIEPGNTTIKIEDIFVRSSGLDDIRPNYEASLTITSADKTYSAAFPCRVVPGTPEKINLHPPTLTKLIPGQIIKELSLEVLDEYGNHVEEGQIIFLRVEGLSFQNASGIIYVGTDYMKKVDAHGFVDLSNSLKVSEGYGKEVSLSVIFEEKVIFQQQFQIELSEVTSVRKELEDDLITSAYAMSDHKRALESLRYAQLCIQQEIKDLQGGPRLLFANASCTAQLLAVKKLELAEMNEHLEEKNNTYLLAIQKFLIARDTYNNLSRGRTGKSN